MNANSSELYYFLRMYSIDLDTALHTVKMLRRYKRPDIQSVLLRDVAVCYIRPFSGNKGEHTSSHILRSSMHVPKSMRQLHRELYDLRMNLICPYRPDILPTTGWKNTFHPCACVCNDI